MNKKEMLDQLFATEIIVVAIGVFLIFMGIFSLLKIEIKYLMLTLASIGISLIAYWLIIKKKLRNK